jgi:hypothetical protein
MLAVSCHNPPDNEEMTNSNGKEGRLELNIQGGPYIGLLQNM